MNKLAIVGSGPNTRDNAPWNDTSFDIWVVNEAPMSDWVKRWTTCFQLHKEEIYTGPNSKQPKYWEWLQQQTKPVYMQHKDTRVPGSIEYPMDEALKLGGTKFFGMTISYMIALALLQGYKHIEVWGIELSWTEYQYGVDTWHYWVGFARGLLGADHVVLHSGEHLFESALYGYEGALQFESNYYLERIAYLDAGWKAADKSLKNIKEGFEKAVLNGKREQVFDYFDKLQDAAQLTGEYAGALGEAEKWNNLEKGLADRNDFELAAAYAQREGEKETALMDKTAGAMEYVANVWFIHKNQAAADQLLSYAKLFVEHAYTVGAMHGAFKENQLYIEKYDTMVQANGGKILPPKVTND